MEQTKCTRCNGTGNDPENWNENYSDPQPEACEECDGTGDANYIPWSDF